METISIIQKSLKMLTHKQTHGVLALSSGLLLTLPHPALETLGLAQYTNQHRHIIGLILLLTLSSLIIHALSIPAQHLIQSARNTAAAKRQKRTLQSLSQHEQEILRQFATSPELGELPLHSNNKAVMALVDKGILLDLRPVLSNAFPQRYYRITAAYTQAVDTHLSN